MVLLHGSNVTVKKPEIITNGYYKDLGLYRRLYIRENIKIRLLGVS